MSAMCTGSETDKLPRNAALLIIDVQKGFDDPAWGARNNHEAEVRIATILRAWRDLGGPVIHIHHRSISLEGRFREASDGILPKPQCQPIVGESVYQKVVNSAFIGTTLEGDLRSQGIDTVVIVGLTTNHCVSTTTRMAANLGFRTILVSDATAAFSAKGINGEERAAEDVHATALSDLNEEFAEIWTAKHLLACLDMAAGTVSA